MLHVCILFNTHYHRKIRQRQDADVQQKGARQRDNTVSAPNRDALPYHVITTSETHIVKKSASATWLIRNELKYMI